MKIKTIKVGFLQTNCYLIIKNKDCIIIDPGDDFNKISKIIESDDLNVCAILITHHHFDHVRALDACIEKYNVKVYDFNNYINDDEIYKIKDFEFKMIDTRGHKDDLITFYFYKDNIMFTGDFIFKGTIGRCDLADSDYDMMLISLDKIKKYNDDIKIYPGHGRNTTLLHEKEYNQYLNQ